MLCQSKLDPSRHAGEETEDAKIAVKKKKHVAATMN